MNIILLLVGLAAQPVAKAVYELIKRQGKGFWAVFAPARRVMWNLKPLAREQRTDRSPSRQSGHFKLITLQICSKLSFS